MPQSVTDAELDVPEVRWGAEDGATVREIVLSVYGRHEHSLHDGVKSFLDRLMEKELIKLDKSGFAHRFHAAISRSQLVGYELKRMAESHYGGSLRPMLLSLVGHVTLTKKDRAAIEKLIENIKE